MAQVDIKLRSQFDSSGVDRAIDGIKQLRTEVNKRVSVPDFGKSVLGGLGLGSGFAIAQKAADFIVAPLKKAAELEARILDLNERTTRAVEERFDLRRTDEQKLEIAQRKIANRDYQLRFATNPLERATLIAEQAELQLAADKLQQSIDKKLAAAAERAAADAKRRKEEAERERAQVAQRAARANASRSDEEGRRFQVGESEAMKILRLRREMAQFEDASRSGNDADRAEAALEAEKRRTELAETELRLKTRGETITRQQREAEFAKLAAQEQIGRLNAEDAALQNELAGLNREDVVQNQRAMEIEERRLVIASDLVTAAEREAAAREHAMAAQLAAGELGSRLAGQSQFLTSEQQDQVRSTILQRQNVVLQDRIRALEEEDVRNPDPARQVQIDSLRQQEAGNSAEISSLQPLSVGASGVAGLVSYLDSIPTMAQRAQDAMWGVAQAMEQGIATSLMGLIQRTMTWSEALANIGRTIVMEIVQSFVRMVAQWITQQIIMAIFGRAIQAAQLAALAPVALATAALWAPAATAASIATMGGAAIEGAAMAKMAILSSMVGFEKGGFPEGRNAVIKVNENGQEAVLNAGAVARLGRAGVDALNNGEMWIPDPALSITRPAYQRTAGGAASGGPGGSDERSQVAFVDGRDRKALEDIERDPRFRTKIVKIVAGERRRLGIRI